MVATWLPLAWILWRAGGARGAAAGFGLGVEWWQYALKQCEAVVHYLRLAVLPWPLVYDYGTGVRYHLAEVWWQAGLLAGLAGMVLWAAARRPVAGFPGLWFLAVLAPSSSVVPLVTQTMAEHRMYLPLAGLMVLGAGWLHQRLGAKLWLVAGPLAVLAIGATAVRNADYRSEERLWRDTAAKAPENSRAHYNLGAALLDAGDIAGAIDALERARALAPDDPGVLNNLANALLGAGRSAEAREHLRHAIALRPAFAPFHLNLGHTWVVEQRWPEARAAYEAALRLDPGLAAAQANLGAVLLQLGDWEAARTASRAALDLDPNLTVARRNLGLALLQLRRPAEAVAELLRAHEAEPGELATLRALAVAHGLLGQRAEALRWAQAGLRVSPADPALQELLRQLAVDRP
jgi:tetratricopeptide (TPR) repeat protein